MDQIKRNTSLTSDQFEDLLQRLPSLQTLFKIPAHATSALYMYLMEMRTALPSEDLGNAFHITRTTVERQLEKVRKALLSDFVYEHVNYIRSREELCQLNTEMGRRLYCRDDPDRVVLICDGTYIYINKSRNYEFQKKTYNDQKKRNFVKIMLCVTCDGEIIYALGPYPAVQNDASIMESICRKTNVFDDLQAGDIFLLDRGFRDCVKYLKEKGFEVKMPSLVQKSQTKGQLSTAEANQSRLVTALRYVVETRNGHLKTIFKIFNSTWNSLPLKHLQSDVEICAAIISLYFGKIESNKGCAEDIAELMMERLPTPNQLYRVVKSQSFQNQVKHASLFDDFDSLPILDENQLFFISLGKYQMKQAESYCQEHLKANQGQFEVYSLPENITREFLTSFFEGDQKPILLFAIFKSRFNGSKKHRTHVLINMNEASENIVLAYCCSCYSGLRTVGCCSHIMCILWYTLKIKGRQVPRPAGFLDSYFEISYED